MTKPRVLSLDLAGISTTALGSKQSLRSCTAQHDVLVRRWVLGAGTEQLPQVCRGLWSINVPVAYLCRHGFHQPEPVTHVANPVWVVAGNLRAWHPRSTKRSQCGYRHTKQPTSLAAQLTGQDSKSSDAPTASQTVSHSSSSFGSRKPSRTNAIKCTLSTATWS